jgi:hypothetical protein
MVANVPPVVKSEMKSTKHQLIAEYVHDVDKISGTSMTGRRIVINALSAVKHVRTITHG